MSGQNWKQTKDKIGTSQKLKTRKVDDWTKLEPVKSGPSWCWCRGEAWVVCLSGWSMIVTVLSKTERTCNPMHYVVPNKNDISYWFRDAFRCPFSILPPPRPDPHFSLTKFLGRGKFPNCFLFGAPGIGAPVWGSKRVWQNAISAIFSAGFLEKNIYDNESRSKQNPNV